MPALDEDDSYLSTSDINTLIEFWLGVVAYFALSLVGMVANVLAVLVLSEKSMANVRIHMANAYQRLLAYMNFRGLSHKHNAVTKQIL